MKKVIPVMLATAFMVMAAFINPLHAQNTKKEMDKLAKDFENAYNKKDAKTLKEYYTKDAVRVNADGTTTNGNDAIEESLANDFKTNNAKIKITVTKAVTESDGSVTTTGTYHATGTNMNGEKIDVGGNFTNTAVKENGHWKISKSVLTNM